MTNFTFHPLSEIFPLIEGAEFDELVADIKANGLRENIWLYEGQILDGRNRYRACRKARVEPDYTVYNGSDPAGLVVSLNLKRRHLTTSQRAMIASEIATLPAHRPKNNPANLPTYSPGVSQSDAAKLLNVSDRSVRSAKAVREHAPPETVAAVERGEMSVTAAAKTLPKEHKNGPSPAAMAYVGRIATGTTTKKEREAFRRRYGWQFDLERGINAIVQMPMSGAEYAESIPETMIDPIRDLVRPAAEWLDEFAQHWRYDDDASRGDKKGIDGPCRPRGVHAGRSG